MSAAGLLRLFVLLVLVPLAIAAWADVLLFFHASGRPRSKARYVDRVESDAEEPGSA